MSLPAPALLSEPRCVWAAGATLGEGTCWSEREQALYWVDILEHRLYRLQLGKGAADGLTDARDSWQFEETISAVAERATGAGLAVTLRRGLALFDPATGALQRLHEPEPEREGNRFNDGKCDVAGRFWAGTMDFACQAPTGALYCFDASGRATRAFDARFPVTNGPTWSLDQKTMYFNDTANQQIHAFDVDPETGTLSGQRPWLRFAPGDGYPDGMTTDADGRLWIAHWGAACVTCHDPITADELLRVPLPTDHITNVAFGGPDLRTLFITSARFDLSDDQLRRQPLAGGLFAVETTARGRPAHRFAG
ncbi:SMP-30/gluconolactonase/LRE family protein [Ideonella sp. DXS29W]|uniref:SMP-30/gluconolactonase/LRE family protein n=1 Tax=Ideonella lacteola TaxID=2984193 RepID=A0ABU9BPL7_9BURK